MSLMVVGHGAVARMVGTTRARALPFPTPSSRCGIRSRNHHRSFAGKWPERERLLQVQPDCRVRMREIANREILPDAEFEIAASGGEHKRALDSRSPDDVAVHNA